MGKPNYSFEKRKKELDRKRKKEEKLQRKQEKSPDADTVQKEDAAGEQSTPDPAGQEQS